uniref:thiol oxidase n=1 Tax=viral metagenome TaxID=1070528 RepID=A0A6C0F464_9ZZZZ
MHNKTIRKNSNVKKVGKNNVSKKKRTYSKIDYNSGDGMLTSVWGPSMWHYLHTMSFNYPVNPTIEDKKHYRNFITSLRYVLPCKYCRMNLKTNLKQLPLTMANMKNRETFSKYVYNLHELVNKMLHKKSNLSYCDVRERYEHFRSRCTEENPTIFNFKKLEKNKTQKNKKEKGCTEPLYGKKSKCIIRIVPQEEKGSTFQMDKKCVKTRDIKKVQDL